MGGVAGGIADHLGISAVAVRLAFIAAAFGGGLGVVLYAVFWIVLPAAPRSDGRRGMSAFEYVVAVTAGLVVLATSTWVSPLGDLFIPAAIGCVGAALLWRQAGAGQRERWRELSRTSLTASADDRWGLARVVVGVALVVVGCAAALAGADVAALRDGLLAVVITLVGVGLITGPWWVRMVTELGDERRERIRSQERANLAAQLHDSVLQTLALIQRNADSPREVTRLARSQERELRALLYPAEGGPAGSGSTAAPGAAGRLGDALRAAAAEVEDAYAVTVDVVVVGDLDLDERFQALMAAAREAMANAARHAGVDTLSVYAEVEPTSVVAYVRDRGCGFDLDAVAPDRQGVRGSIVDRMERHGGEATVESSTGAGTEVTVRMPR
ncbi:MAG: PspC domain-containing protein [Acidimicrobiales bacterium]|nr:PspC domain-containing protein [Acidimicrobiales bacterium]